ncbi:MAG: CsgG/HfaB family protein, partial [Desulfosalsimonadaceae bacterium]|nr:CsgG/HfaB family protein [Desulfosalsimonadaceae bacterium]
VSLIVVVAVLFLVCGADSSEAGSGNLRYSITVSKFKNEAGWAGKWDVGDGFTTIMTDALQNSKQFVVLGDKDMRMEAMEEQDFAASGRVAGGKKAPKKGQMTPAQLLVRGSITHVQESTTGGGGGLSFQGITIGGSTDSAEVNITMYLVDSETGQVKSSTKVVGKSGRKGLGLGYHGSKLGGLGGDMEGFMNDNVGKACEDAVGQGVDFLVAQLEEIPWEGTVSLVSSGKIAINRGAREGVEEGARFDVGQVKEIVDEDTGEVLDSDMAKIATLEATSVKEKISYCKIVSGGGVQKGMTVMAVK